jgi:hypothetical protein
MNKPKIKDKEVLSYVEYLESRLKLYEESPYFESYQSVRKQLDNFNHQLLINPIDLFAESTDKSFDRTKWYFDKILELNTTLDNLRKLMTPEDQAKLEESKKIEGLSVAEKLALNNRKSVN